MSPGPVLQTYKVSDRKQSVVDDASYVHRPNLGWPFENISSNWEEQSLWVCEVCANGDDFANLVVCDGCHLFNHTYCIGEDRVAHTSDWYCPSPACQALAGQRFRRQIGNVRTADDLSWILQAQRQHGQDAWQSAWHDLDAANLALDEEEDPGAFHSHVPESGGFQARELQNRMFRARELQRMNRRRAAAARQIGNRPNAFEQMAWMFQTGRPKEQNPHLALQETKEEQDSWKLLAVSESIDNLDKNKKRRRGSNPEEKFAARLGVNLSPPPEQECRRYKRPRTKRIVDISSRLQTRVSSESPVTGAASAPSPPAEPASGGLFSSILEGIGKAAESPVISTAAGYFDQDLTRMRPLSPDQSGVTSPTSRVDSPTRSRFFSPSSPPHSRSPSPPDQMRGRPTYSPSSPRKPRTPAQSPTGRAPRWISMSPSSPPGSRDQSPNGQSVAGHAGRRIRKIGAGDSTTDDTETTSGGDDSEHSITALTLDDKENIVGMVKSALKPLYPEKISKTDFTRINKVVSRKMYKLVCDRGLSCARDSAEKEKLKQLVEQEVQSAVTAL